LLHFFAVDCVWLETLVPYQVVPSRLLNQPALPPINQRSNTLTNQPTNQPTNQATNTSTNQPDQSRNQQINQSTNQPTSKPINPSIQQPINPPNPFDGAGGGRQGMLRIVGQQADVPQDAGTHMG
jgi:hypothetical protein